MVRVCVCVQGKAAILSFSIIAHQARLAYIFRPPHITPPHNTHTLLVLVVAATVFVVQTRHTQHNTHSPSPIVVAQAAGKVLGVCVVPQTVVEETRANSLAAYR
jgi:hypothetical protein